MYELSWNQPYPAWSWPEGNTNWKFIVDHTRILFFERYVRTVTYSILAYAFSRGLVKCLNMYQLQNICHSSLLNMNPNNIGAGSRRPEKLYSIVVLFENRKSNCTGFVFVFLAWIRNEGDGEAGRLILERSCPHSKYISVEVFMLSQTLFSQIDETYRKNTLFS